MSYKLVCVDMDGTLLDDNNEVSKENELALKKCIENGIEVAITTGRLYGSAKEYADKINLDCHIIASNGTFIKSNNKVIYSSAFTNNQIQFLSSIIRKHNLKSFYNTDIDVLIEENSETPNAKNKELKKSTKLNYIIGPYVMDLIESLDKPIYRVAAIDSNYSENLISAKNILLETNEFEVVNSMPNNIDIAPKGNSKGSGVEKLSNFLNINNDNILCIGDRENDISMINFAGMGIAMGNAMPELKIHANYITDNNNNSGVAKAINKFIFND